MHARLTVHHVTIVGPERGTLILRTTREGLAAPVGHDLTIEVARWSGEIIVASDPARSSVQITAELGTLRVLAGTGGIRPLSDRDRREILRNARHALDSDHQPRARFVSSTITPSGDGGGTIDGMITLAGKDRPLRLKITALGDSRYRCTGRVIQTEHGIKPYVAFLGALKLADPVTVEAEVDLSGSDQ
jgi:polyisoprenoid-binding protein YceI